MVFVGGAGLIASSPDGTTWTRQTSGTTGTLYGVAYGAGRFVAVGERGTLLSSADGATWVAEQNPYTGSLAPDINGVTFANGRFLAAARSLGGTANETIITSPDGRIWTRQTVDRIGYQMQFIAYGNGQYIAGGGGILMVSTDAISWRTVWTGQTWLYAGVRGDSRWVVSGNDGTLLTSTDGAVWTETKVAGQRPTLFALAYRNGRFLGVGSNSFTIPGNIASVFSSADGLNWTPLPFPETATITRNDTFQSLLPTTAGYMGFGAAGLIATTTDGTSWNVLSQPAERSHFSDVVYGNGVFVAVGSKAINGEAPGINAGRVGAVYTSTDSWHWDERVSGVRGATLAKAAFGNGRFVAVGPGGTMIYSDDGIAWKSAVSPMPASWTGLAYGAGRFVAVGPGAMASSTDGVTWRAETAIAGSNYWTIRFVNGSFFRSPISPGSPVQRSFDGLNWSEVTLASSAALNDIAFSNGLWVAATSGFSTTFEGMGFVALGALQVSTDGLQWTAVRSPGTASMQSVQWAGDRWVAGTGDGTILTSTDARNWRVEERPTQSSISRLVASPNYTVTVGPNHTLLTTRDPRTVPARQSVALGQPLNLSVSLTGTPTPTVQWLKDDVAIPGATNAVYQVAAAAEPDAGTYTAVVTSVTGTTTRSSFIVTVLASRIVNLSIRSAISAATPELTVGFVVSGTDKPLLVRAVGPTLTQFGVNPVLPRPGLGVYAGPTPLIANEGWDRTTDAAQVSAAALRVGAFALPAASDDAAVLHRFGNGNHSAIIRSRGTSDAGTVLLEIYDAEPTLRARLANVSALARVGTGDNILVAGFVVQGNVAKRLLIRAIGPSLAGFGRTGVLADPQLTVTPAGAGTAIAVNNDWGGNAGLAAAFQSVGAFPLANDSRDAAVVLTLAPGGYTVQISGFGNATGDALVELYELP